MGGMGGLRMGLKYPDTFAAVVALESQKDWSCRAFSNRPIVGGAGEQLLQFHRPEGGRAGVVLSA
jgi:hypothetical protein